MNSCCTSWNDDHQEDCVWLELLRLKKAITTAKEALNPIAYDLKLKKSLINKMNKEALLEVIEEDTKIAQEALEKIRDILGSEG